MSGVGRVIGTIFGRRESSAKGQLRAAGLSDAERLQLADGALASQQMGVLRGLQSARFNLADRGYSKAQVDRLFGRLALIPGDLARWRSGGRADALDNLALCARLDQVRFSPEPMGYAPAQVDAVLTALSTPSGPFHDLLQLITPPDQAKAS